MPPSPPLKVRSGQTQLPEGMAAAEAPPPASSASPSLGIDWGIDLGAEAEAAAPSGGINWDFGGAAAEGPAATAAAAGIDWELGAMADSSAQGVGISWDIGGQEGGGSTAEAPAVDWGIDVGGGASAGAAAGDAGPAIDWGIDMSDIGASGATAAGINWDLSDVVSVPEPVASPSSSGGAIEGPAAVLLRLERDADYRAALLDDLQELRAFLLQVRGMQLRLCLLLFFVGYSPYWFQTCHAHSACTFMFKPSVLHLLPDPAAQSRCQIPLLPTPLSACPPSSASQSCAPAAPSSSPPCCPKRYSPSTPPRWTASCGRRMRRWRRQPRSGSGSCSCSRHQRGVRACARLRAG